MFARFSAVGISVVLSVFVFLDTCHAEAGARSARSNSFARKGTVRIASGGDFNCVANGDGTVSCWGLNFAGELGNSSTTDSQSPVKVTGLTNAIAVTAGESYACALLADSSVRCWGVNDEGQLGNGSFTDHESAPVIVSGLSNVVSLSAGTVH